MISNNLIRRNSNWLTNWHEIMHTIISSQPISSAPHGIICFGHDSIHIHFRLRCCPCPIPWGWQTGSVNVVLSVYAPTYYQNQCHCSLTHQEHTEMKVQWIWKGIWPGNGTGNNDSQTFHTRLFFHYSDAIMDAMASRFPSLTIVYSTVYSGTDQRKHQSSASLAFMRGFHRWPVNSPHKGPVTRKIFPFDDVIMLARLHSLSIWYRFRHLLNKPHQNLVVTNRL